MHALLIYLSGWIVFCGITVQANGQTWDFIPETAASVGSEKISARQITDKIDLKSKEFTDASKEQLESAARLQLAQIIEKIIILDLMSGDGIKPSPAIVITEYQKAYDAFPPEAKDAFLQKIGIRQDQLSGYWEKVSLKPEEQFRVAFVKWLEHKMRKIKVSDDEVETFYRENQSLFKHPETVTLARILIRIPPDGKSEAALEKAEKNLALLKQGADFRKLAAANSECRSAIENNGIFGIFSKEQLPPDVAKIAFGMEKGQFSDILRNAEGFSIIQVVDKSPAGYITCDKVADLIQLRLKKSEAEKAVRQAIARRKAEMDIKIFF